MGVFFIGGKVMATKTFPYAVIINGNIIPANTPIEVKKETTEEKAVETPKKAKKGGAKNDNTAD